MSDQTLEAVQAQESSTPAVEVKEEAVQSDEPATPEQEAENQEEAQAEPEKVETAEELKERLSKEREQFQKRMNRKTAAQKHAEERSKALEDRVQSLTEQLNSMKPAKADEGPSQDDYDTYEEWEQATVDWKADKKVEEQLRTAKEQELQQKQAQQKQEQARQFAARQNEFMAQHADYENVAKEAIEITADLNARGIDTRLLEDEIIASEFGPQLVYHIGKNDLVEELASLPPRQLLKELWKLEQGLLSVKTEVKKNVPPPIKPVSGNGKGRKSLDQMTFEERNKYFASLNK